MIKFFTCSFTSITIILSKKNLCSYCPDFLGDCLERYQFLTWDAMEIKYMKTIVKSPQIMKFNIRFTLWFGPGII